MKKILYITVAYLDYKKKIDGQISAFHRAGYDVFLALYDTQYLCLHREDGDLAYKIICKSAKKWGVKRYSNFINNLVDKLDFDILFFRRIGLSLPFYKTLINKYSKDNKKFIYEIPTYPFEKRRGIKHKLAQYVEERYINKQIYPKATCIPVYCRSDNCKVEPNMVLVENCVDCSLYDKLANIPFPEFDGCELRILAVAHCQPWHAYERLLRNLASWKETPKIKVTIYGNHTPETKQYIDICNELNLQDLVDFPEEKDVPYYIDFVSNYHIAMGCLGIHRKDKTPVEHLLDTSIKNKEYCAMGIPFFHSTKDVSFTDDFIYHLILPDNEDDIDINLIVSWAKNLFSIGFSRQEMMEYAKKNLSFDAYACKVIEKLNK